VRCGNSWPNFLFIAVYSRKSGLEILVPRDTTDANRHFSPSKEQRDNEVFIRIVCYLWRAVDQHGVVIDILVQVR
jgi:transposase-like protein